MISPATCISQHGGYLLSNIFLPQIPPKHDWCDWHAGFILKNIVFPILFAKISNTSHCKQCLLAWQAGWAQASPRELPRNSSTACLEDFSMADVATLQKAVEKYEKFWPRHLILQKIEALGFPRRVEICG